MKIFSSRLKFEVLILYWRSQIIFFLHSVKSGVCLICGWFQINLRYLIRVIKQGKSKEKRVGKPGSSKYIRSVWKYLSLTRGGHISLPGGFGPLFLGVPNQRLPPTPPASPNYLISRSSQFSIFHFPGHPNFLFDLSDRGHDLVIALYAISPLLLLMWERLTMYISGSTGLARASSRVPSICDLTRARSWPSSSSSSSLLRFPRTSSAGNGWVRASFSPIRRDCAGGLYRFNSDWRSPLSLRAQIRSSAAVIERFERKIATMGRIWVLSVLLVRSFLFCFVFSPCMVFFGLDYLSKMGGLEVVKVEKLIF